MGYWSQINVLVHSERSNVPAKLHVKTYKTNYVTELQNYLVYIQSHILSASFNTHD